MSAQSTRHLLIANVGFCVENAACLRVSIILVKTWRRRRGFLPPTGLTDSKSAPRREVHKLLLLLVSGSSMLPAIAPSGIIISSLNFSLFPSRPDTHATTRLIGAATRLPKATFLTLRFMQS